MNSANHQWLSELENDDLGELDFIDQLSMQQLAESLADELWDQQPTEELQVQLDQHPQDAYSTGFSFLGDINKSYAEGLQTAFGAGADSMLSFADGESKQQSFSAREPKHESIAAWRFSTQSATTMERKGSRRTSSILHEHVITERKRREKMQLQFATLASIIPDISKTDQVSLLGSTIDYVHHLKDRLKALQEEHYYQSTGGNTAAESLRLDSRCSIDAEDDSEASPKIEANVRGTTVLLRVVCRDKKGVLIMVLKELEKHGLSIISTNVLPLADSSSLNITVTAQIEDGSSTAVELVNNLYSSLTNF